MVGEQKCNLTPGVVFLLLQEVMAPSDVKDASAPVMTLAGWSWDPPGARLPRLPWYHAGCVPPGQ